MKSTAGLSETGQAAQRPRARARESTKESRSKDQSDKKVFFCVLLFAMFPKLAIMLFFCPSPYLREASFGFLENRGGRILYMWLCQVG